MTNYMSAIPYVLILFAFILSVFLIFESIEYVINRDWKAMMYYLLFCMFSLTIVYANYNVIMRINN